METFVKQSDKESTRLARPRGDDAPAPLDEWQWAQLLQWVKAEGQPSTQNRCTCCDLSRGTEGTEKF